MPVRRVRTCKLGYSLPEAMISLAILSLLFVTALTVYVASFKLSMRVQASVSATTDAGLAIERIMNDVREAAWIDLPDDPSSQFTAPPGVTSSSFSTTYLGNTVDTAVEIVYQSTSSVTVSSGTNTTVSDTIDDRNGISSTQILWIYRSDASGTPNAAGGYLWINGSENGTTVDQAIMKSVDPTSSGAVQFSRPYNAASSPSALPYQLQAKIVSSYYSPVNGNQTSESTNGTQATDLAGRCVEMRNHDTNLDHDPGSTTVNSITAGPWTSN
jgi:type II secretory pathway pseudopilin PulG